MEVTEAQTALIAASADLGAAWGGFLGIAITATDIDTAEKVNAMKTQVLNEYADTSERTAWLSAANTLHGLLTTE